MSQHENEDLGAEENTTSEESKSRDFRSKWGNEENPNVNMARSPITTPEKNDERVPIYLLPVPLQVFNEAFSKHGALTEEEFVNTEWGRAITLSAAASLKSKLFIQAQERKDSNWGQYVEHEGLKIGPGVGGYDTKPGGKLVAGAARNKFLQMTGSGGESDGVMFHSGFKITIKTPLDPALSVLDASLTTNKEKLGYMTQGMVFTRQDILLREEVYNFCKEHIVFSNIKDFVPDMLDDLLLETDFYELVKTMADAIYINGYKLSQPCIVNPSNCRHVTEDNIVVRRTTWVDTARVTPLMAKILSSEEITIEQIKAYQEEAGMTKGVTKEVITSDDGSTPSFKMVLTIPTIGQSIKAGKQWIEDVGTAVQQALSTAAMSITQRKALTEKQIVYTILKEYLPYIKRVVYEDDSFIENPSDIEEFLLMSSGHPTIRREVVRIMQEYYDEIVLSFVAIPAFKCKGCGKINSLPDTKHPFLIPIDVLQLFFDLKDRKLL